MENAADAVVPLRPGFDIQVRGFNRSQVIEHLELLEDQLKIVTVDRNEAVALNSDLRRLCDDLRNHLTDAEQRLQRIESSDTGLPAASQRVQNMLSIAEDEVQTLRDQAKRQAEIIRGTAETEARELIEDAERAARELRAECAELVADLEARREEMRREHAKNLRDLREREQHMRQAIRDEYKFTMMAAQEEADELLGRTREQCAKWDAESEQLRLSALEEIRIKRTQNEDFRLAVLSALENARNSIGTSAEALRAQGAELEQGLESTLLPKPREDSSPDSAPGEAGALPEHSAAETADQTAGTAEPSPNGSGATPDGTSDSAYQN